MSDIQGVRRLTRSRDERIIAGVCGGVAEYASIDPNIVRLVLAISCVFGGAGFFVYALGWLLMPDAAGSPAIAQRMARQYLRT
ncbi:MAG: PspC domain-containing protein [Streptosporangiaceae bacterium]